MNYLAAPNCLLQVSDHVPHILTYEFGYGSGLTSTGVAAITAAITTYLSAAKQAAIINEWNRHGGPPVLPAMIVGTIQGGYPVLDADLATQVAALQALIAGAGNAG